MSETYTTPTYSSRNGLFYQDGVVIDPIDALVELRAQFEDATDRLAAVEELLRGLHSIIINP